MDRYADFVGDYDRSYMNNYECTILIFEEIENRAEGKIYKLQVDADGWRGVYNAKIEGNLLLFDEHDFFPVVCAFMFPLEFSKFFKGNLPKDMHHIHVDSKKKIAQAGFFREGKEIIPDSGSISEFFNWLIEKSKNLSFVVIDSNPFNEWEQDNYNLKFRPSNLPSGSYGSGDLHSI